VRPSVGLTRVVGRGPFVGYCEGYCIISFKGMRKRSVGFCSLSGYFSRRLTDGTGARRRYRTDLMFQVSEVKVSQDEDVRGEGDPADRALVVTFTKFRNFTIVTLDSDGARRLPAAPGRRRLILTFRPRRTASGEERGAEGGAGVRGPRGSVHATGRRLVSCMM